MILERLFLFILIVLFSCTSESPSFLIGKWHLDSISIVEGRVIHDNDLSRTITFSSDGSFTFEQMKSDVGFKSKGKYFINKNTSRSAETITLLFDFESRDTTTIRQGMNLDILELNNRRMKLVDQTKFLDGGGKVTFYNRISIYGKL